MTHRTFISIILAAAIAVTGMTAAPARADNDAAKVIAGVAALAIIGAVIAEERKDRRRKAAARNHVSKHQYNHNRRYKDDGHRYRYQNQSKRRALPVRCRRDGFTRRGDVYGYGRRCLLNNYSQFNALPHNCAVRAQGYNGGQRVIYSGRCLRKHGYVTPG